jgi:hypothetical protein
LKLKNAKHPDQCRLWEEAAFSIERSAGISGGGLETPEISCLLEDLMISEKISWALSAEIFANQLNL